LPPWNAALPSDLCGKRAVEYDSLYALVVPFYLPSLASQISRSLTMMVLPLHVLSLGFSFGQVGMLITGMGVALALGNIPAASATTAYGPRFTLIASCVLLSTAAACACVAPALPEALLLPMLVCVFSLFGVADAMGILARQTFVGILVQSGLRGRVASALGGCNRLAMVVGASAGGCIAERYGLQTAYAVQAIVSAVSAVAVCAAMPAVSASHSSSDREVESGLHTGEEGLSMAAVARAHWRVLLVGCGFTGCAYFMRKSREMLLALEGHARDMSQAEVGRIAAFSYLVECGIFPLGGYSLDMLGRARTGAVSFALMSVALLAMQVGFHGSFTTFAVIGGLSNGMTTGLAASVGNDLAPPACRGNFLAVFRLFSVSADPAAASLLGFVADATSLDLAEVAVSTIAVCGAACALFCAPGELRVAPGRGDPELKESIGLKADEWAQ